MMRALAPFIISILLCVEVCSAQSVGVVMSGGGAKGLYHIGVLEALEESGVPIDYVAGTSIGSIIAGLYAAGYSPEEMTELALSGEIEKWVSGKIERNLGAYLRLGSTLYKEKPTLSINIETKKSKEDEREDKIRIPKSLISTTQIDMAMVEIFTPASVASNNDFSQLMVPFLCMTSDITANKGVVLTHGDLGKAIRSSMALPLAFTPIVSDEGHLLYDGGMYDNFPWRAMIDEFNPELIIGSICGIDSWADSKNLSITDQAFLLAMEPTNYDIEGESAIIKRDVPVGILDFSKAKEIIRMGYYDTIFEIDGILSRIDSTQLKTPEYYTSRREAFKARAPKLLFDSYNSLGLNDEQRLYLQKFMMTSRRERSLGEDYQAVIGVEELRENLYKTLSGNDFTTSYPSVSYDPSSRRYQIGIGMEDKPPLKLSASGYLSSTQFNQIYLGASYKRIRKVAHELFGELYLGPVYTIGRVGYRADFYLRTPMFIDTYFDFSSKNLSRGSFGHLTSVTNTFDMKNTEPLFSVGIGAPISRSSLALFRVNFGSSSYKYTDGLFFKSQLNYSAAKFEIERNTLNNINYPTDGSLFSLSVMGVDGYEKSFADDLSTDVDEPSVDIYKSRRQWIGVKAAITQYHNISRDDSFSIGVSAEGVFSTIPEMTSHAATLLYMPSYNPIAHTQMVYMPEYSAHRYIAAGIMPSAKLYNNFYLQAKFHAMLRDKYNEQTYRSYEGMGYKIEYISQLSFTYESGFGPASLALTKYNINSWDNLYLMISFGYPIFAPKGTFY